MEDRASVVVPAAAVAACTQHPPTVAADAQPAPPSTRYAWYLVAVLCVAYTLSFVDRMILALLVEPIRELGRPDPERDADAVFNCTIGAMRGYVDSRRQAGRAGPRYSRPERLRRRPGWKASRGRTSLCLCAGPQTGRPWSPMCLTDERVF